MENISVKTDKGVIIVGIKADTNYPGVYVDFVAKDASVREAVPLAIVEYEPDKDLIQTCVCEDCDSNEYSRLIEHKNLPTSASWFMTDSDQFMRKVSGGVYDTIQIIIGENDVFMATRNFYHYSDYSVDELNHYAVLDGYDSFGSFINAQGEFYEEAMISVICKESARQKVLESFSSIQELNTWLELIDEFLSPFCMP